MTFTENNMTIYGTRYDTHMESDGHELYDESFARFCFDATGHPNRLEEDIDKAEYSREVEAVSNYANAFGQTLPNNIALSYYQNDQTEFWDDTKYLNLRYDGELLASIPKHKLLNYIGENSDFPHYALIEYINAALLIGYED